MNIRVESGNMFPPRTLPGVRKTFDKSGDGEINVRPARRLSIHVVVIFSVSMTTSPYGRPVVLCAAVDAADAAVAVVCCETVMEWSLYI